MEAAGYYQGAFQYLNQDTGFDEFLSELKELKAGTLIEGNGNKPIGFDKVFTEFRWKELAQVLKGKVLNAIVEGIMAWPSDTYVPEPLFYEMIATALQKENWWKFGKSPSLRTTAQAIQDSSKAAGAPGPSDSAPPVRTSGQKTTTNKISIAKPVGSTPANTDAVVKSAHGGKWENTPAEINPGQKPISPFAKPSTASK
jgi:hypothetical protein